MTQITSVDQPHKTFSQLNSSLRDSNIIPTPNQFLDSLQWHKDSGTGFDYRDVSDILGNLEDEPNLSIRAKVVDCCIGILESAMESEKSVRNAIYLLSSTLHEWENDSAIDKNLLGNIDISGVKQVLDSVISTAGGQAFNRQLEEPKRDAWYKTGSLAIELVKELPEDNLDSLTVPRGVVE